MPNKYLPLGSIVRINNVSKNIMITGYYSLEYNNSVKIYDYVGCSYPEGLLIKNNSYSFNHSDIQRLVFKGYQDDDYAKLNSHLLTQLNDDYDNLFQPKSFINLKFDKNGVVVYDEVSDVEMPAEIVETTENPFTKELLSKNEVVKPKVENKNITPEVNNSNLKFTFDANGFVTGEVNEKQENVSESSLVYEFDENGVVTGIKDNNKNNEVLYKFDANGNVIAEEKDNKNLEENEIQYEFDENGVVTGTTNNKSNEVSYKFDNNGNVIAEDKITDNLDVTKPQYKFDENGMVVSEEVLTDNSSVVSGAKEEFIMPHYKFDPNGIIIE